MLRPGAREVLLLLVLAEVLAWYRRQQLAEIDLADAAYMLNRLPVRLAHGDNVTIRPSPVDVESLVG
jgi:hypothetical protein